MYSLLVLDKIISVHNCDFHTIGNPSYDSMHPYVHLAVPYIDDFFAYIPFSYIDSIYIYFQVFIFSGFSVVSFVLVHSRYITIYLIAPLCSIFGSNENCVHWYVEYAMSLLVHLSRQCTSPMADLYLQLL